MEAVTAHARGESVPTPPSPPKKNTEPIETPEQIELRQHRALCDDTARYLRAQELPYDRQLADRLIDSTSIAAMLPPVISFIPYDLDAVAMRVAAVARNATTEQLSELTEKCVALSPEIAAAMLFRLAHQQTENGSTFEGSAVDEALIALGALDLSTADTWHRLAGCGRHVISVQATLTSEAEARGRIATALAAHPEYIGLILGAFAEWVEQRDSFGSYGLLGFTRRYTSVPPWLPATEIEAAIRTHWPDLQPDRQHFATTDNPEVLAGQFLFALPCTRPTGAGGERE